MRTACWALLGGGCRNLSKSKNSIFGQFRCIFDQKRALPSLRKKNSKKPSHFSSNPCGANQIVTAFSLPLARRIPLTLRNHSSIESLFFVKKVVNSVTKEQAYELAALVVWETAGWYPSYWPVRGHNTWTLYYSFQLSQSQVYLWPGIWK